MSSSQTEFSRQGGKSDAILTQFSAVAGLSVPPPFRGRGRPLDALRESGITNFYWQYFQTPDVAEREFERDVGLTMRTVLGRGFSDPAASLFIEAGKGFLGDVRPDRSLPEGLSEADLAYFTEADMERVLTEAETEAHHRGRRPLDSAGASRRGQRRLDRVKDSADEPVQA